MTRFLFLLLFLPAAVPVSAQRTGTSTEAQARVRNVQFSVVEEGRVSITYDLLGPETDRYWVKINLRLTEDGEFIPLRGVTGDIGSVQPGTGRTATWSSLEQYPFGINSSDVVFRVTSEVTARDTTGSSGIITALLILGAVGGLAYYFINGG